MFDKSNRHSAVLDALCAVVKSDMCSQNVDFLSHFVLPEALFSVPNAALRVPKRSRLRSS